jgi:hypothetical protein
LISWKRSFGRLSEKLEAATKKKQTLDNLLNNGRISQSRNDVFNKKIDEAIADIEKQRDRDDRSKKCCGFAVSEVTVESQSEVMPE